MSSTADLMLAAASLGSATANPLIGASSRETVENAAEALSAAVVLLADRHSDLCRLLMPILGALEHAAGESPAG